MSKEGRYSRPVSQVKYTERLRGFIVHFGCGGASGSQDVMSGNTSPFARNYCYRMYMQHPDPNGRPKGDGGQMELQGGPERQNIQADNYRQLISPPPF